MKFLICTGCMGISKDYSHYTINSIQQYAKKISADFFLINDHNRKYPNHRPTYEKYQLIDLLLKYKRILWIDCDVIINPQSPNIFEEVDYNYMGVLFESPTFSEKDTKKSHKVQIRRMQERLGYINWESGLFNAGIMMFSNIHRKIFEGGFEKYLPLQNWKWNDQAILNYKRVELKIPTQSLNWKWNAMPYYISNEKMKEAYFLHFAGQETKRNWNSFLSNLKYYNNYFYKN